jgi:hypothetical protein
LTKYIPVGKTNDYRKAFMGSPNMMGNNFIRLVRD